MADVARCADILERLLSRPGTRTAWIMGFLVGSSMTGAERLP